LQYSCPVVELGASLHLLLACPVGELQLLIAGIIQLVTVVVVGMLLHGEEIKKDCMLPHRN